jgi:hypothetical protein
VKFFDRGTSWVVFRNGPRPYLEWACGVFVGVVVGVLGYVGLLSLLVPDLRSFDD